MSKAFFNVTPRKNLLVESISQDGARQGEAGVGGETGNKLRAQPPPSSLVCGDIRHVESEKSLNGENEAKLSKDEEEKCLEKFACWFSARKKLLRPEKKFARAPHPHPALHSIHFHFFFRRVRFIRLWRFIVCRLPASRLHCSSSRREMRKSIYSARYLFSPSENPSPVQSRESQKLLLLTRPATRTKNPSGGVGGVQKMFTTFPRTQKEISFR
jgi:hypothetical protein